jgi:TetR/AcrR family transcriptional regulator, transcriptional repressor for nem operon
MKAVQAPHQSKVKLLDAALRVIRTKGYTATTVDDICDHAGVTKGSFFYHFNTKEELAIAAAAHFGAMASELFTAAPYQLAPDPRDRLLGYVDFRMSIFSDDLPNSTCLYGTMVQETYETHPAIRSACDLHLTEHVDRLAKDASEAKQLYAADAAWDPLTLASFIQCVLQGAFVLAKARNGPSVALESLLHLRRYLEMLLPLPGERVA